MTREQWKERLPLIQAFCEGKEVQVRVYKSLPARWNVEDDPKFDLPIDQYRIKPEPRRVILIFKENDPLELGSWSCFRTRADAEYYLSGLKDRYDIVELVEVLP